ncbi:PHP domain-containing protein [bacterium]|nr:PHP domain-containing protein [bacterium]
MFLADFHVHSNFSDGKLSIPEVVDLYGRHGFGAIAITDHLCESQGVIGITSAYLGCSLTPATYPLYLEIIASEAERAWEKYRMVVLPGYELTKNMLSNHRSAHIVAIGTTQYLEADGEVIDLVRSIRAQGGISIAAHPVWTRKIEKQTYYLWDNRFELQNEFDAWEVASGPFIFDEVAKTKLPKIANSDLHLPRHLTAWKNELSCERHPEAILEAIRKQQMDFRFFNAQTALLRELEYASPRSAEPFGLGSRHRQFVSRDLVYSQAVG